MAITIKEIHVKTTISNDKSTTALSDEAIEWLRESIVRELKEEQRKKMRKSNER